MTSLSIGDVMAHLPRATLQHRRSDMVKSHYKAKPESVNRHGQRQRGVTSIEYALMASLIAIAIVAGVSAAGGANALSWATWVGKVVAVLVGV
jgi:Flp pilus assembly pilin Flp